MATATKTYAYTGQNKSGESVQGTLTASSESEVAAKLRGMGLTPTSVKRSGTGLSMEISLPGSDRVSLKDLAIMARQFATMIDSGLSLLRALNILADQTESKKLKATLADVRDDVEAGQSLSNAMAKHSQVFPPIMISMVRAGEVGGFLDKVLVQLADNFEAEVKLRGQVKAAMTYPVVVFVIAMISVVAMLLFIVPVFQGLFEGLGGKLPLPTRILVTLSAIIKFTWPIALVGGIALAVVWAKIKNRKRTREIVDPLKLKAPIFGELVRKIALSRFSRNLSTMLSSGVPLLQCLNIVGSTSGNIVIEQAVAEVEEAVRRGESLALPLSQFPVFPPMMVQMLAVGEDVGAIDDMLRKLADFYDAEVESTTQQLSSLIEPLMIVGVGIIIGGIIVGLYMPIFSIFDLIQ